MPTLTRKASMPVRDAESLVKSRAPMSQPAASSFASSIDAYVHSLEHALVPPPAAPSSPPPAAALPAGAKLSSVPNKIRQLRLVKQQLEKELDSVARGTLASLGSAADSSEATRFAQAAAAAAAAEAALAERHRQRRRRPSSAQLLREKAALQRRLEAYRREKVRGFRRAVGRAPSDRAARGGPSLHSGRRGEQ